ncbi:unnamed protein product [Didymodactylos carnosus]|uniref:Uncharacterized protein n=1 Tax=Didymodactylos carnosus TaxID=1234261 RepID=A0A8S2FHZ0_9BILA|nr:unnamed protein product [Didymodactylos carnosus]CAF4266122.1 unnamed protein product [Didymodactylos carnosus]
MLHPSAAGNAVTSKRMKKRHSSQTPPSPFAKNMPALRSRRAVSEQVNLHDRVMQLNQSPVLSASAAPAIHKDNWQQRRYNFLSKNKMFGAELKDELVGQMMNEQGSDIEQRPMVSSSQIPLSGSMDSDGSNIKRESIIGMAVSSVRNLLTPYEIRTQMSNFFDEV